MIRYLCLLIVLGNQALYSQEIKSDYYKSASIPESLLKDANSVVRYSKNTVHVKNPGKATFSLHSIITVLNENASDLGVMYLSYNKYNSIDNAEMRIYNSDGVLIKKYRKTDLYDGSATDEGTIISDDRFKAVKHVIASYPSTIEIITEQTANSFIDLGSWELQSENQAVEKAVYQAYINPAVGYRYSNQNTSITPIKGVREGEETYLWEVNNLAAKKIEDGAERWAVLPKISFAANLFEFNGMPGDMTTWENFGKWIQGLNKDGDSLSPQRCLEIQKKTENFKTDKEKAKYLYEYMQKNMRYVSIQLGIGGLKPFPASFVDQKKYGDCKALSNYMYALLKAVNIPSYYTVINAGENKQAASPTFVNDPFDHIILCVPFKQDTTWLECTSNVAPFGVLGTFTENRYGMLITESGGKLVRTPISKMEDNRFDAEVNLTLEADGAAKSSVSLSTTGGYREEYDALQSIKTDEQKDFILRSLKLKQPKVFELKYGDDKDGVKKIFLELEYDKFADVVSGDKRFYKPFVFNVSNITLPVIEKREADYYFPHPMQKSVVTNILLPEGYEIEAIPINTNLKSSYGSFEVSYVLDVQKNQLTSIAKFMLTKHVIPAVKYNEIQLFFNEVAKAQNKKLVIRKKV